MNTKDSLIQSLINQGYLKSARIIEAFRQIDRADFVLPEYRNEAYANHPLPIGEGQTISQPLTVAFMLELLNPKPGEKILDIGFGSGWTTALLAYLVSPQPESGIPNHELAKVFAIERIQALCQVGAANIGKYSFVEKGIVQLFCQDGIGGLPEQAPFDKILAGAAASREIPKAWREQLKVGGKIVAPVASSVWIFTKKSETAWEEEEHPGFAFVPLIGGRRSEVRGQNEEKLDPRAGRMHSFFIAGLLGLIIGGIFVSELYLPHTSFAGTKTIEIQPGLGSREIGELLKQEGIIRSKWLFVGYLSLKRKAAHLKPGSYTFGQATIPQIAETLIAGHSREITLTFPEGWTLADIATHMQSKGIGAASQFRRFAEEGNYRSLEQDFPFLAALPRSAPLEGYLFPDTYDFFHEANAQDIARVFLTNFNQKLAPDLRDAIKTQKKELHDIIIMASLIEKEVKSEEDRKIVSGILWKRLELNIPLQVDATITYLTGKKSVKISRAETQIDSPYNTYKYRGFPKGPIANPGLSAIRAAIYPQESPYLYYLSGPDGRTVFSKTLEEHNVAKAKYLTK